MGRTWARKRETPVIKHNFYAEHLSAIAGITLEGRIYFRVHNSSIKKKQIIEYLKQLMREIDQHIILLWDGASPHRANLVKDFLKANKDRVTAFRLPPYCPDFNPVEWLWTEIKWAKLRGYCPKTTDELKQKLRNCIRSLRRKTGLISSYFRVSELPLGDDEVRKLCRYQ